MADEQRELKIVVSSDTSQAEDGIKKIGGGLDVLGGTIAVAAGNALYNVGKKALEMGKDFITSSIDSYNQSEKVVAQLDSVLRSTAGVAGTTKDSALALASSLQDVTAYSDETILSGENLLLTFTNIGKDIFPQATETILDMSQALGQDTKASAIQLGKALQDPILGVSALRRVGVNFSEDQQNVIKSLVETGHSLDAQKLILKELSTEFGGSARAYAKTYAGQMEILKNVIDDTKEAIGKLILDGIMPFVNAISPALKTIRDLVNAKISLQQVIDKLKVNFPQFALAIDMVVGYFRTLGSYLKTILEPALDAIRTMYERHKEVINILATVILGTLIGAISAILVIGAGLVIAITTIIDTFFKLVEYIQNEIAKAFFDMGVMIDKANIAWENFKKIVLNVWNSITSAIRSAVQSIIDDINRLINSLKSIGDKASNKIGAALFDAQNRAIGGFSSGMTVVGENGPELVSLPTGSFVHTNQESQKMMAGGSTTININNPVVRSDNDIQQIVRQVEVVLGRKNELARMGAI